jgi:tetratricopeptide (TPR) repeat protein
MKTVPPPPAGLDAETEQRWEEIRKLAVKIDELNYFEMLKVEPNTPPNEIRSAFFALAKKWHPDRLPEALLPLKPQVETVFGYLSQAHQCLSNEQERQNHIRSVKEGGGTPAADRLMQKVLDGAMAYQRVEVLARKREYDKALELLERVINLSGDEADYHAMQAWLLLQKYPEGEAPFKEMIDATDRALKLSKDHERAVYYRGLILKRMKRDADALKFFRRAAELNPKNLDALREVRIATMRKGEKNSSQKGLFTGLFKKK